MITICPQCQLPLAVTAADLRVAQGQVRCGRCAAVFNALASLYDAGNVDEDRRSGAPASRAADAANAPQNAAQAAPHERDAAIPDVVVDEEAGAPPPAAARRGEPGAEAFEWTGDDALQGRDLDREIDTMTAAELAALVVRAERDEPDELAAIQIAVEDASDIVVMPSESPRVLQAAEPQRVPSEAQHGVDDGHARSLPRLDAVPTDDPQIESALAAVARASARSGQDPSLRWLELEPALPAHGSLAAALGLAAEGDFGERTGVGLGGQSATPTADAPDPALEIAAAGSAQRGVPAPRWMRAATVVLGLALAAQLLHLNREELVGIPALEAPLTSLYGALGRPVAPRWDVGRYEVRQQGVVAEPVAAGTLTVRASIRNGASRAQPAPLLRVTLQDRFGNRIATRDLTPREYGGAAATAPAPMLAPGQRIDAEVSLLDPGGEAVGFELDVCLRRPDASITCASDAPAAHA